MYNKLFEPGKIGGLELKNRVVMTAMGCSLAEPDGHPGPQMIEYYKARAKGGAGLIITEITRIDDAEGASTPCQLSVTNLKVVPGLVRLTDAVHAYDTKILIQLHHAGNQISSKLIGGRQPVSASDVTCSTIGEQPRALSTEEVEGLVKKFVTGAVIAQLGGADGVEIHAAHGYLVGQFLSPHTNHRTDKYGGDLQGRMRFLIEIVMGIRQYCGPKFVISVRMDGDEFIPDGLHLDEAVVVAKTMEKLGVDVIDVSCGTYESGITIVEPNAYPEAWPQKVNLAKTIRENIDLPVIAVNNIKHPATAEKLLEDGVSDFVGVARGQLADPEWTNKAKAGHDMRIRKCINCMECFRLLAMGRPLECTLNPVLGREYLIGEEHLKKDGAGRTVAVIGGGPAGMEAALTLAKRGFHAVLFEEHEHLGGTVNLAAVPPHKERLLEFIDTMALQMKEAGVDVRLSTPGTVEACQAVHAEAVFVATGGYPIIPSLKGTDKAVTSTDVLTGTADLEGKNIVVIGGGVTGLETAEYLAVNKKNKVTLVEMMDNVGAGLYKSALYPIMKALKENGAEVKTSTKLTEIEEGKAIVETNGQRTEIPCDAVVLAMGVKPDRSLADDLQQAFDQVIYVGDCQQPGQIREALHAGYDKAFVYE